MSIIAAMLASIATRVDPIAFFDPVLVVHAVLCTASVLLAYRIAAPARMTLFVWSLISLAIILLVTPFYTAFWLNQPQISVTFLILLAFELHVKGASVAAGVALGIAVAIKITPAVFNVIFVMDRNFRAAGVTIAVALAVLGFSVAIAGIDLHRAFLDQLVRAVDFAVLTPLNYSLEGLAATFAGIHGDVVRDTDVASGFVILETSPWFGLVSKAMLLCAIAVVWRFMAGGNTHVVSRLLAIWAVVIFFGPLAWSHYLIGPVLLLPALFDRLPAGGAILGISGVAACLSHPTQSMLLSLSADRSVFMALGAVALCVLFGLGVWVGVRGSRLDIG
jgi:hypothetical protein